MRALQTKQVAPIGWRERVSANKLKLKERGKIIISFFTDELIEKYDLYSLFKAGRCIISNQLDVFKMNTFAQISWML